MLLPGALPLPALATELGEPVVRTYIGQPLVADIELTGFAEAAPVQVRLAHPEVYNGARIRMHPILANLTMSVMRRDGRQFLHITSTRPVDSEYVHLFLELADGPRRDVRVATLWLTPDPAPPPPPAPAPVPKAEPAEPAAAAEKPEPALPRPSAPPAASPLFKRVPAPRAAACVQQFTEEQIKTCAALDYKNGVLAAQIVDLEEKVRLLQMAIEGKKPAAPPPLVAPPKPKTAAAAGIAAKPKAEPKSFPWQWVGIGVGILLLSGGLGYWLWRRKKGAGAPAAGPGMLAKLKARFGKKKEAAAEARQEPAAE